MLVKKVTEVKEVDEVKDVTEVKESRKSRRSRRQGRQGRQGMQGTHPNVSYGPEKVGTTGSVMQTPPIPNLFQLLELTQQARAHDPGPPCRQKCATVCKCELLGSQHA